MPILIKLIQSICYCEEHPAIDSIFCFDTALFVIDSHQYCHQIVWFVLLFFSICSKFFFVRFEFDCIVNEISVAAHAISSSYSQWLSAMSTGITKSIGQRKITADTWSIQYVIKGHYRQANNAYTKYNDIKLKCFNSRNKWNNLKWQFLHFLFFFFDVIKLRSDGYNVWLPVHSLTCGNIALELFYSAQWTVGSVSSTVSLMQVFRMVARNSIRTWCFIDSLFLVRIASNSNSKKCLNWIRLEAAITATQNVFVLRRNEENVINGVKCRVKVKENRCQWKKKKRNGEAFDGRVNVRVSRRLQRAACSNVLPRAHWTCFFQISHWHIYKSHLLQQLNDSLKLFQNHKPIHTTVIISVRCTLLRQKINETLRTKTPTVCWLDAFILCQCFYWTRKIRDENH